MPSPKIELSEETARIPLELAFVLAPGQNLFFVEFVEALRAEVTRAGAGASVHVGNFPPPRPGLVYVLVPPHEYFTLLQGRHGPLPDVLKRTIFICAEQPGTPFFDNNLHLAPLGGAVFDINRYSVRAFREQGIDAEHLQLGWTEPWDHFNDGDRDIDVLFMGSMTDRRAQALGSYAKTLSRYRAELLMSDNSRPNWVQSGSFRTDDAKWNLLRRCKILLNIHQEEIAYFEWLRIVQAMSTGAVVVSEHSIDISPLVPGEHLMMGDLESLPMITSMLLHDNHRRWQLQQAAYAKTRHELPLAAAVQRLIAKASELADRPIEDPGHRFFTQPQPHPEELPILRAPDQPASPAGGDHNAGWIRRALKDLRLEILELRRDQARAAVEAAEGSPAPPLELVARTDGHSAAVPRVSILTALFNHASSIVEALDSATRSRGCSYELIVVDDGSSDESVDAVVDWMSRHRDVPALLLRHPVNRGLAPARNDAFGMARGELCFVLDADNAVYPHCLERLVAALDGDPEASFAYGMLEAFTGNECVGLMNAFPWDPERLRTGNYIDAMAMMRTSVVRELGGYSTDRRLHGWEDFALWCSMASAGHHGIRVTEIVGRYRVARHSMLSLTNISATDAFSVLIEANPKLMAGVIPPE